ncbi:Short-chain dehydrogenase/reductase family member [Oceanicola granulosus HTCC2516]|uniref:Short-chain dehydrogenase/reductase family member n=1 Tax=Oceanicola granulosus (strain ATCC BAA-861 / DSM 15982 / KCTC 12143 / HTCC2516) TaxID=314256 RepID=Q2CKD4_OCEGH|nr:Short-chain dehydrogenase/reductase family member [Oceanicola granulosus HTCC2516]
MVGASEGLGRALAEQLSRVGCELVLSARSEERLEALAAALPGRASAVPVDVTDADSVAEAAGKVGKIDGVIYMAGAYWPMSSPDWDTEKAVTMVETNLTGAVRIIGAVLPEFLSRNEGHIVLTSSLSAFRGLPGSIGYGASKAGVLTLAEGMHADLRHTKVEVQVVNPGFIRTRMTDKNEFRMPQIMEPEQAAQEYFEHMNSDAFKKSFPFGLASILRLAQFLPDWLYFPLFGAKKPSEDYDKAHSH